VLERGVLWFYGCVLLIELYPVVSVVIVTIRLQLRGWPTAPMRHCPMISTALSLVCPVVCVVIVTISMQSWGCQAVVTRYSAWQANGSHLLRQHCDLWRVYQLVCRSVWHTH